MSLGKDLRRNLFSQAHDMKPCLIVGKHGVKENTYEFLKDKFETSSIVKIRFNHFKENKQELVQDICTKTESTLIRIIGHVAVLYKESNSY